MSEYDEINATHRLAEVAGAPYTMCAMMAISQVRDWAKKKGTDPRRVEYIFEDGDEDQGELVERAKLDGSTRPSCAPVYAVAGPRSASTKGVPPCGDTENVAPELVLGE